MKRVLCLAMGLVLLLAGDPGAASAAPLSPAQRQNQIDRIKDGLNSPDGTKRLVTLEQAIGTNDPVLRRVALSTAFASSDRDLRSTALAAAIGSTATFVVDVAGTSARGLPSSFEVRILKHDRSSNTFRVSSSISFSNATSAEYVGAVTGDRLSFQVNAEKAGYPTCSGVARLETGSPVLKGSMTCAIQAFNGEPLNFSITVDVPK